MKNKKIKYTKLVSMLISNDKNILLISALSIIIGFTFLFVYTSMSKTIIKTRQDNTVKTYGKFLMVLSDISEESEEEIKQKCSQFEYEKFEMFGNVKYKDKKIAIGTMEEDMGKNLAFQIIKGKWPKTSNQIVVEEYLLHLFGIEDEKLPVQISLQKEGKTIKYEITGVISNYSYLISTNYDGYLETKAYPSIICGGEKVQNMKQALVIMQKKLNFKNADNDIDFLLNVMIDVKCTMCINERLYAGGYKDNEDILHTRELYIALVNFFLLIEQVVIIKAFLLRNKKTLFLFEALGMSSKERKKVIFYLIQGFIWFGLITGYLLAALIGLTYMDNIFKEYNKYYMSMLNYNVLIEVIIAGIILSGLYFLYDIIRKEPVIMGIIEDTSKEQKKYKFKKMDFSIIIIQTVCIFFTIASFDFINTYHNKSDDIDFYLCSKQVTVSYPMKDYRIAVYGDDFFTFDVLDVFKGYKDKISLSTIAETKQSAILLKEDNIDSYFRQYCKKDEKIQTKDKILWKQVSNEAGQYKAIPTDIVVLPQKDFQLFLKERKINNSALEKNEEGTCVLILPNYKQAVSNPSVEKKEMIQIGGIYGNEKTAEFCMESFKVEEILSGDEEESSSVQIIMSEEVAKKSKTVVGYDRIRIVMKKDTPIAIQKDVEQNVLILMASVQGGLLDSSGLRSSRDELMGNYTSIMCNTMIIFCIIVICIHIIFSIYVDWEKYNYEYGVLRSFGMSYSTLQNRLFFRYSNSIIIACVFNIFLGKYAFTNGLLTKWQILISIGITVGITYLCRIWLFFLKKKQSISSMLNSSVK